MYRILFILFLSITMIQVGFGQISEKIDIYFSGGTSYPVESVIGKSFEFPQLNNLIAPDFAQNALNLQPDVTNFKEFWKTGINIGAGLAFKANRYLAIMTDFNYSNFTFNKGKLEQQVGNFFADPSGIDIPFSLPFNSAGLEINQGSINMYQVMANFRLQMPMELLRPYIIGGAGYLHIGQESININYYDEPYTDSQGSISFYDQIPGTKQDALILNGGVGVLFYVKKTFQPFIQVGYNLALTNVDNTIYYPVRFGFNFSLN